MYKTLITREKRLVQEYAEFSKNLDKVVSKLGISKVNALLKQIVSSPACIEQERYRVKALTAFTKSLCVQVFALEESKLLSSNIPEYREARMACYLVLRKLTQRSYEKIAEDFCKNKRHVMYYCIRGEEDYLAIPQFRKAWMSKYNRLEAGVINYLIQLEEDAQRRK